MVYCPRNLIDFIDAVGWAVRLTVAQEAKNKTSRASVVIREVAIMIRYCIGKVAYYFKILNAEGGIF